MKVCPAFIDETGSLTAPATKQPVFGIGLLIVHEPQLVTENFYRLHFSFVSDRMSRRHGLRRDILSGKINPTPKQLDTLIWKSRHHEYKFVEVSGHNVQQYIDLMDAYFALPGLEFHALLIDRTDSDFNLSAWNHDAWKAYVKLTHELLKRRLKREVFAIVDLQGAPNDAEDCLEDTLCRVPSVAGCIRATSDMSVFLQIVDVLLGCVQFDWRDYQGEYKMDSNRANAKRNLTSFVKARLGMEQSGPILTNEIRYRRLSRQSAFSAWLWGRRCKKVSTATIGVHPANGTTYSHHSVLLTIEYHAVIWISIPNGSIGL